MKSIVTIIGWNVKGVNEGKCYSDDDNIQISDVNLRQNMYFR